MEMRIFRVLPALVLLAFPLRAEEVHAGATLKEITRDAEERLKQWDEEDAREQQLESRYWWLGLVELALSLTFGRAVLPGHGLSYTRKSAPALRTAPDSVRPAAVPPSPPSK